MTSSVLAGSLSQVPVHEQVKPARATPEVMANTNIATPKSQPIREPFLVLIRPDPPL